MLLKIKHIRLNRYLYYQKILRHSILACLCSYNRQLIMHIMMFCPKHIIGQTEMYYYAGIFLYKKLLTKPKTAKTVTDRFMQTNLLLYLLPRQEKIYQHFCSIWQHLAAKCAFRALRALQHVAYGLD